MSFPFTVPLTPREVVTSSSIQRCPLGTRGATADGRIYRYAKNGATALVKSYLVQSEAATTAWENSTASYLSTAFLTELGTTYIPSTCNYLHLTATGDTALTVAKNYYKEGWLWVNGTSTSAGQKIKIGSHNVASSGSTGLGSTGGQLIVTFESGFAISENLDTAATIAMQKNEYDKVIVVPTTATNQILGVPDCNVPANYFFWLQTWGICAVRMEAEVAVVAKELYNSTQTAGAIQGITGSTDLTGADRIAGRVIGVHAGEAHAASQTILVHLTLAP